MALIPPSVIRLASASRQCTVEIENASLCYSLVNPRMNMTSGLCSKPLPIEVHPGTKDDALFIKTPNTAKGVAGVFTYDLHNTSEETPDKMAVMFSVPYNFNFFSNWYAVGIFSGTTKCDYDLYYEMYYKDEVGFVRGNAKDGNLTYEDGGVVIQASMSDAYTPYLRVNVKQK